MLDTRVLRWPKLSSSSAQISDEECLHGRPGSPSHGLILYARIPREDLSFIWSGCFSNMKRGTYDEASAGTMQ
jgi:hypothetical protein